MIIRNPLGRVQTRAGASDQAGYCRCQGRTRFALGIRFSRVSALMGLWPGGRDGYSERMYEGTRNDKSDTTWPAGQSTPFGAEPRHLLNAARVLEEW